MPVVLAVQAGDPAGLDLGELLVARRRAGELVELLVDGGEHAVLADVGRVHGGDDERVGVARLERAEQPAGGVDVGDQRLAVDQALLQPGAVALGEDRGEHEVGEVAVELVDRVGHPVADRERGQRRVRVGVLAAQLTGGRRLGERGPAGRGAGRDVAEVLVDQVLGPVDLDVARDREHGVGRRVVGVEELRAVVEVGLLELGEVAVPVVRVGERVVQHRRQQDPGEAAVGPVEHVEADLLLDHVDLVAQVLLGDLGRPHAVGLEEQRALEAGGGQHHEVVGVVRVGGPVEGAAGGLHVPEVRELLQALAALEHQVLEEVREAGAPLRLGPEAHVVVHAHADDR